MFFEYLVFSWNIQPTALEPEPISGQWFHFITTENNQRFSGVLRDHEIWTLARNEQIDLLQSEVYFLREALREKKIYLKY